MDVRCWSRVDPETRLRLLFPRKATSEASELRQRNGSSLRRFVRFRWEFHLIDDLLSKPRGCGALDNIKCQV